MKIAEVREHSSEELHNLLEDLRKRMFDLRSQAVTEKLEDPSQLTKTRKDIAKVLTVLNERHIVDIEAKQHHLERVHSGKGT